MLDFFFQKTDGVFVKCFLVMIEKMKPTPDDKEFCAAILIDLKKPLDCICHDLLIAKLNTYGFDRIALKLIYDYLSNRSQKTKVSSSFSAYLDIIYGLLFIYGLYCLTY